MLIHSEFFAKNAKHRWMLELFNQLETAADGGYSRVVPFSEKSALKATCCGATNLLFNELWSRAKAGTPVPHNLPAVFKRFGSVLVDRENFEFCVWEVERLFEVGDFESQKVARAISRRNLSRYKPGYSNQVSALTPNSLASLRDALQEEQNRFRGYGDWTASVHIAVAMVSKTEGPMRDTFVFLKTFVETHKVHLDLLGTGNILVNMFGEPCLCDAVCDTFEGDQPRILEAGTVCVVADVPIEVQGLSVNTQYRASPPVTSIAALEISKACLEHGLTPNILQWGSPELIARLAQPVKTQPVWNFPSAAIRLRRKDYAKALCQ